MSSISEHRLVAHAHHRHDGHLALLEDQHLGERAALAHDGDAGAVAARHAIARPHVEAEPVVQHAVAVGPDDRHVAGGLDQAGLQSLALRPLLREPGRVAHRAPRPALRELGQDIDAALRRHRDIGAVRPLRQVAHGGEHRVPVHLRTAGMHVPHLAPEAEVGAVAQCRLRPRAPDERDVPGTQQALDVQPALGQDPIRHSSARLQSVEMGRECNGRGHWLAPRGGQGGLAPVHLGKLRRKSPTVCTTIPKVSSGRFM